MRSCNYVARFFATNTPSSAKTKHANTASSRSTAKESLIVKKVMTITAVYEVKCYVTIPPWIVISLHRCDYSASFYYVCVVLDYCLDMSIFRVKVRVNDIRELTTTCRQ